MSRTLVAVYVVAALVSGLLVGRFSSLPLPFDKPATPATPATASEVSVSGDRLTAFERGQLITQCYLAAGTGVAGADGAIRFHLPSSPSATEQPFLRILLDSCLFEVRGMQ